jgi:hypothetical protein
MVNTANPEIPKIAKIKTLELEDNQILGTLKARQVKI